MGDYLIVIADKDVDGLMASVLFLRRYGERIKGVYFTHAGSFVRYIKDNVTRLSNEKVYVVDIPLTEGSAKYVASLAKDRNMKFILIDHHLSSESIREYFDEAYVINAPSSTRILYILWKNQYRDALFNYYVEIADYIDSGINPSTESIRRDAEMLSRILAVNHKSKYYAKICKIIAQSNLPLSYIDELVEMDKRARKIINSVLRKALKNSTIINGVRLVVLEKILISAGYLSRIIKARMSSDVIVVWHTGGSSKVYVTMRSRKSKEIARKLSTVLKVIGGGGRGSSMTLVVRSNDVNDVAEKIYHVLDKMRLHGKQ